MGFTKKQRVFIEEYLKCWNATEAALRAGYSERTAYSIGSENLSKPEIKDEIDRRVKEKTMSADEVLTRLAEQARNEQALYIMPGGYVDLPQLIADGKQHLIKGIKDTKYGQVVEFVDSQAALFQIGRHHKLFTDRVEMDAEINVEGLESLLDRIYGPDNNPEPE